MRQKNSTSTSTLGAFRSMGHALLVAVVMIPCYAWAVAATEQALEQPPEVMTWAVIGQLFFALLVIVSIIVFSAWVIQRLQPGFASNRGVMKIIAMIPVGTRERVMLIQVGEQQILLGVTQAEVSLLHILEEPVSLNDEGEGVAKFSDWLGEAVAKRKKGGR